MIMDVVLKVMRRFWNSWELKIMVLLNLVLQVLLLVLGNRRKSDPRMWVRAVVWLAYIAADSVGGVALGMVSSKLGDDMNGSNNSINEESKLIAFWAPSLLLLLGGPDTITAYSMEDNELWLRHLLGLVVQTGVSAYICMMAWSTDHTYLSYLSLAMMVSASIKYGERVWVLWHSSKGKRKDLILGEPYAGTNYPTFMEEYSLKQQEGYHVVVDEIVELPVPKVLPDTNDNIRDAHFLVVADYLRDIVSRLFLDLVMSDDDRDTSLRLLQTINSRWEEVFKLVEMELSFMYDLLHTKAKVLYSSPWGVARRFISLAISSLSLIVFCLAVRPSHYNGTNLSATFLLLGVIVFLDVYSLSAMLTSDWTRVWLAKKGKGPKFGLDRVVPRLNWLTTHVRWSNSVGQLSLLSFCTKRESVPYQSILKKLNIQEKVEAYYHVGHQEVLGTIKRAMLEYVVWRSKRDDKSINDVKYRLSDALKRHLGLDIGDLEWSTEMEFDKCILVWHIATELCYHHYGMDREEEYELKSERGRLSEGHMLYHLVAKILSHYMYYLLVIYPFMLPSGIGQIRVRDTRAEARKFFQERGLWSSSNTQLLRLNGEACTLLVQVNTEVPPNKVKGERSKSVLFDGCRLASALLKKLNTRSRDLKVKQEEEEESKIAWRTIADVWIEILAIAARQCPGDSHALQLRRGGELLTFQWLLMAHYGLTDHFQMTKGHAIAKLILH